MEYDVSCGLVIYASTILRYISSISDLLRGFFLSWKVLNFINCFFCICWDDRMIFTLRFVNVVYHTAWFADVGECWWREAWCLSPGISPGPWIHSSPSPWVLTLCCGGPRNRDHRGQSGTGAGLEFGARGTELELSLKVLARCPGASLALVQAWILGMQEWIPS